MPGDMTPFGIEWDDLDLQHVQAFLAEPREEAQTWDGKGGVVTPETVRKYVSGFANTGFGGYLVLGADQNKKTKAWTISGWIPRGEAAQWITDCIVNGVDPVPAFDASKTWPLSEERVLTVVRVWPLKLTPCITTDGYVFERIGTSTPQVRDAASLHRLVERGQSARQGARTESMRAGSVFQEPRFERQHQMMLGMGVPALPRDTSALILRESVATAVQSEIAHRWLQSDPVTYFSVRTTQESLSVLSYGFTREEGITVELRRTGGIAVALANRDRDGVLTLSLGTETIEILWALAAAAAHLIGGYGPCHIFVYLTNGERGFGGMECDATVEPDRWTLDWMQREARRILGKTAWEPE